MEKILHNLGMARLTSAGVCPLRVLPSQTLQDLKGCNCKSLKMFSTEPFMHAESVGKITGQ